MLLKCMYVVQDKTTTASSLSRLFATPHGPPHIVTHTGETPQIGLPLGSVKDPDDVSG